MSALAKPRLDLAELATTANREHHLALQSGQAMVQHAILAGEALIQAKEACDEGWHAWLTENFSGSTSNALNYMRIAVYADKVRGLTSVRQALDAIIGEQAFEIGRPRRISQETEDEARALHEEDVPIRQIARSIGVSQDTVTKWVNPEYREHRRRYQRLQAQRKREERAAQDAQAEARRLKRVAREKGGGIGEAYSLACRMEDALGQALREATGEAAAALSQATADFHKMRDEIVRALGAS